MIEFRRMAETWDGGQVAALEISVFGVDAPFMANYYLKPEAVRELLDQLTVIDADLRREEADQRYADAMAMEEGVPSASAAERYGEVLEGGGIANTPPGEVGGES